MTDYNKGMTDVLKYYDEMAKAYTENTVGLDMEHIHTPFLDILGRPSRILDLGCGPGRDAQVFHDLGHDVVAMDGSVSMCELAWQNLPKSIPVVHSTYAEMNWQSEFDGVWACASLVHLDPTEMFDVLSRIHRALRSDGVLYSSLKLGMGESRMGGRKFWHWRESEIHPLLVGAGLIPHRHWVTLDARKEKPQLWLNITARKPRQDR